MVLSYDSSGTVSVKSPFLCPAGERRHSQYYGSSFVILTSSFFFFPLRFGTLLVRSVSGASHTLTIETPTVWCLHLCPRKPACSNILLSAAKPLRCLYCLCFPQMSDWHQQTPWRSLIPVGSDTNTQVTADLMDWCVFVCVCVCTPFVTHVAIITPSWTAYLSGTKRKFAEDFGLWNLRW